MVNKQQELEYGIAGYPAPEFEFDEWIDGNGKKTKPVRLSDFEGSFKIIYCFQSWCQGCHSIGFPNLKKLVEEFDADNKIQFLAIQTVFEGFEENSSDKIVAEQKRYELAIPFGHDAGDGETYTRSSIMWNYRTGGTPWFIFVDTKNTVISNGFHIDLDNAIRFLRGELI